MGITISEGRVYDPANHVHGLERDIHVENGVIVDSCPETTHIIDARKKSVMPAGIDPFCHVAAFGLNLSRNIYGFPLIGKVGAAYNRAGYLHLNEPYMTLSTAEYVKREVASLPQADASALLVPDLRDFWQIIKAGFNKQANEFFNGILKITGARGFLIIQSAIKYERMWYMRRNVNKEKLFNFLSMLNAGKASRVVLEIPADDVPFEAINPPDRFHLNRRGGEWDDESKNRLLKNLMEGGLSVGVCADDVWGPLEIKIGKKDQGQGLFFGLGLSQPLSISAKKEDPEPPALKLLKFLVESDTGRICLSPGSAYSSTLDGYAELLGWLLRGSLRPENWNKKSRNREYSISDLVLVTRTNPAALLGLEDRGHLSPGVPAYIAVYDFNDDTPDEELVQKLGCCQYLIKGDDLIIDDFKLKD